MAQGVTRIRKRRAAAVVLGKLSGATSRLLGKGGGTALPGVVAERIDPEIVRELSAQLRRGSIVVSGTNGKTTTARMIDTILSAADLVALRNESGSNLMRGLASVLVSEATLLGNLSHDGHVLGLFEVDEAALPEVLSAVVPRTVLLLDLFRDQLDRYGEVATVARLWSAALRDLSASAQLIANADDPLVTEVTSAATGTTTFFGIESADRQALSLDHAGDVKACPRCGGRIVYSRVFLGHLGQYACSRCDFRRPTPEVKAEDVRLRGAAGSEFRLVTGGGEADVHLPLPGLYNVYNALAAAATATSLGLDAELVASALARVTPAFGRMERLTIEGRTVVLALAKNPTGLNEVLRTIGGDAGPMHLMLMLNDNIADGRDVSWIWDADVEMLAGNVESVVFSGSRAEDMALRFKYGGVLGNGGVQWDVVRETEAAFERALALTPAGGQLFVVPTYTALLEVRGTLSRLGYVKPYWEE